MKLKRLVDDVEALENFFENRTKKHIERVCKYGKVIGKDFSNHDADKLTELRDDYKGISAKRKDLNEEQLDALNRATTIHITTNEHHPEFGCDRDFSDFTRQDPPMGLDCTNMPDSAIEEMCADWCACSEEFGNTPQWGRERNIGNIKDHDMSKRWLFNDHQLELIDTLLDVMWQI